MCVYPNLTFRAEWIYPVFGLSLMIFCWFLPYVVVSAAGLLSKLAPEHLQSRAQVRWNSIRFRFNRIFQTVRTVTEVMAQVLSPFWTGYMQHSRYAVLVFQLTFMSICTLLTILSWKFLKPSGRFDFSYIFMCISVYVQILYNIKKIDLSYVKMVWKWKMD